ncbi:IS1380-Spn1 transposase [Streptococcus pneumoniae]|nr:IS1380-Spn1 transposase [Streptococcus pneumoniae]
MEFFDPQLFTPNLKTIQNPCLSLDPGWFLFSPNGCFLLDKKEFPLYGISVEKNTKRKETHMNSLPNHHFQNKSFYQLSFDGGHLTQYGGLIFFQELFSQLKLKERISKYLVTNDQRRYCRYSDSDILVQFLFQLLTGYGTDYACKESSLPKQVFLPTIFRWRSFNPVWWSYLFSGTFFPAETKRADF